MAAEKDPAYDRVGTILKDKWKLEKLLGLGEVLQFMRRRT